MGRGEGIRNARGFLCTEGLGRHSHRASLIDLTTRGDTRTQNKSSDASSAKCKKKGTIGVGVGVGVGGASVGGVFDVSTIGELETHSSMQKQQDGRPKEAYDAA